MLVMSQALGDTGPTQAEWGERIRTVPTLAVWLYGPEGHFKNECDGMFGWLAMQRAPRQGGEGKPKKQPPEAGKGGKGQRQKTPPRAPCNIIVD